MTQAYPLQWPMGVLRSQFLNKAAFSRKSISEAVHFCLKQIALMGGELPVISTNLELRNDGLPYANQRQPEDLGAAILPA